MKLENVANKDDSAGSFPFILIWCWGLQVQDRPLCCFGCFCTCLSGIAGFGYVVECLELWARKMSNLLTDSIFGWVWDEWVSWD